MNNKTLHKAKKAKSDDFYTQLEDIEKELQHYVDHFKGKVVYCNCDDPSVSNFFRYFSLNFEHLGLKKLITTCYKNQSKDLFSRHNVEQAIYLEYEGDKDGNNMPDDDEIGVKYLKGDGDFRSEECIELLKQADIVVTNPPFSLFRQYVAQLIKYDKKFLIIGNQNAITFKDFFPYIKHNKVWLGVSINSGGRWFAVPSDMQIKTDKIKKDAQGNSMIEVEGVRWFTNLDHDRRHKRLILDKKYTPENYPEYDNYDAIEVSSRNNIPADYDGMMGVPISFLLKYNPDQFEILGDSRYFDGRYSAPNDAYYFLPNGEKKTPYRRIMIKHKKQ